LGRGTVGALGLRGFRVMVRVEVAEGEEEGEEGLGRCGCEAGRRGRTNCVGLLVEGGRDSRGGDGPRRLRDIAARRLCGRRRA
jgi:hypothetical protein